MTLSFPNNLISACTECELYSRYHGPVPSSGPIPAQVMFIGEAPGCFVAGTMISVPDGVVDICDVHTGDIVLGATGNPQPVIRTFNRKTNAITHIEIRSHISVDVTPDHPVLVVRARKCYSGHARRFCFPCSELGCKRRYYLNYKQEWIHASSLHVGDYVVLPSIQSSNTVSMVDFPQRKNFNVSKYRRNDPSKIRFSDDKWNNFTLDDDLAYVLGWYMAEGSAIIKAGVVRFHLGSNDSRFFNELHELCRNIFGIDGEWYANDDNHTRTLALYSTPLAAWFLDMFGSGSHGKRVPRPIFNCSTSAMKRFIEGWHNGDGKHTKSLHSDGIVTVSKEAACGLRDLLLRLGVYPTMAIVRWKKGPQGSRGIGYQISFPISFQWRNVRSIVQFSGMNLARINSTVTSTVPECDIYNIETGDNAYLVPFVVHNSEEDEPRYGKPRGPFIGRAGRYLDSLLLQCGLNRESIYISNVVKCRPPDNATPKPAWTKACSHWLDLEIDLVHPQIIVAMGAPATRRILGDDVGRMDHVHGKPVVLPTGCIVLPCYHPAAALHDTAFLRHVQDDFNVLLGLLSGRSVSDYHVVDEYPNPIYRVVDTPELEKRMISEIHEVGEFAIDTETWHNGQEIWSAQISTVPGEAWFIPIKEDRGRERLNVDYNALVILHNYLFDIQYLSGVNRFVDTMVQAYLLGLPQGLKELASRMCGVNMINYSEMVRPMQRGISLDYLNVVVTRQWPKPEPVEEIKWDNKVGKIVSRMRNPQPIGQKVKRIIADSVDKLDVDPYDRWQKIDERERRIAEDVLGPMPESTLADIAIDDAIQYACRDSDTTLRVKRKLDKIITDNNLGFVLNAIDLPVLPQVREMMDNGMAVDMNHLKSLSDDWGQQMGIIADNLAEISGRRFNPGSSQQTANMVYGSVGDGGLGFEPTRKTPSGGISTDDRELKKIDHPVIKEILRYRGLAKNKDAFADALLERAVPHKVIVDDKEHTIYKIHTNLKVTRTETGRLSSSDPNMQAMPVRSSVGKRIRDGFIATVLHILLGADFSQQEICVVAHESNCKFIMDILIAGGDIHAEMASRIFGISLEEATEGILRYLAKRLNFGVIYDISAEGLAADIAEHSVDLVDEGKISEPLNWSDDDCAKIIKDWYKLCPEVKDFRMGKIAQARRYGYVTDMFSRRRYVPEVSCPIRNIREAGERQAGNMPIQAGSAGITKLAMGALWRGRAEHGWQDKLRFLLQIHDDVMSEALDDREFLTEVIPWYKKTMEGVVVLRVPLRVDIKMGYKWGAMEKWKPEESVA